MRGLASIVTAALLVASPARGDGPATPAATSDDLADARRLQADLEYERALARIDQAIARGGSSPGRLADLHELAGELAAGLDRAALAEDHFARALALRPSTALPPGTSPRLAGPFAAATARGVPPLQITPTVHQGLASLAVGADPLGLAVGISVHVLGGHDDHADIVERAALRVVLPPGLTVVELAALDAAGNEVWVGPPRAEPPPPVSPPRPPPPAPAPHHASWVPWAIGTGVVLAGAGLAGWRERAAQDEWNQLRAQDGQHDFSALTAVEDRGRRWALAADLGFGIAAAGGVVTALLWWRGRGEPAPTIALTPGGASLGVAGGF